VNEIGANEMDYIEGLFQGLCTSGSLRLHNFQTSHLSNGLVNSMTNLLRVSKETNRNKNKITLILVFDDVSNF